MLDWPEANQTSPMRRSVRVTSAPSPERVSVYGSARGFGSEPEAEGAASVGDSGDGLRVELGSEVRAGRGPSPDVDGAIALQNRVVAEHVREANFCAEGRGQKGEEQDKDEADGFHEVLAPMWTRPAGMGQAGSSSVSSLQGEKADEEDYWPRKR